MCATVVLRSQDCLRKPYGSRRSPPANVNPNTVSRSCRRKRSPTGVDSTGFDRSRVSNSGRKLADSPSPPKSNNLVMGQVKILKRGEALPDSMKDSKKTVPAPVSSPVPIPAATPAKDIRSNEDELVLCSTGRLGPDPQTVQMQIRASDLYAGLAPIIASPPPSSLPFPAFFSKEKRKIDAATNDLLRLLRLDMS